LRAAVVDVSGTAVIVNPSVLGLTYLTNLLDTRQVVQEPRTFDENAGLAGGLGRIAGWRCRKANDSRYALSGHFHVGI
jgi:hypothetical protein